MHFMLFINTSAKPTVPDLLFNGGHVSFIKGASANDAAVDF